MPVRSHRLFLAALATLLLALPSAALAALPFTEDFSGITNGTFGNAQDQSGLALFSGAGLPGWTKAGSSVLQGVDLSNANGSAANPANYAGIIFADNVLTLSAGIAGSNTTGQSYTVSYKASPVNFSSAGQGTTAADALRVEVLRADGSVLASRTFQPGVWSGGMMMVQDRFQYTGDGSGAVRLRISSTTPASNQFAGAIDEVKLDVARPAITVTGLSTSTVYLGTAYTELGATAVSGDGSALTVTTTGTVNAAVAGPYTITYTATDAVGNVATATRTVNVVTTSGWAESFYLPNGVNGSVLAIAESADAFFYGGSFTFAGGIPANNLVRVDKVTGAVTALGSAAQNGTNSSVSALAVLGTDLYVGGAFFTVSSSTQNAISANRVAKWSTTTSTWAPLGGTLSAANGMNGSVAALAVLGTDLYVGGFFINVSSSTQSSISANRVAKWSTAGGTANTWSALGSTALNGMNNNVAALAVLGTDLYVGGQFTTVSSSSQSGASANYVAKWSTTGSTWAPLGGTLSAANGASTTVSALAVMGTDLYVGGSFTTVSSSTQTSISANKVAKWSTAGGTGNTWAPLGSAAQNGTSGTVQALAVLGTDLYACGIFTSVSSATQLNASASAVAKWSTAAGTWAPLGSAAQNGTGVSCTALAASGTDIYLGGGFTSLNSSTQLAFSAPGVARWSATALTWSVAVPCVGGDGLSGAFTSSGTISAVLDAGSVVYVGGFFTRAGTVAANNIACWTKATRTWSALGSATQNGTNSFVNALAVLGTDLYVGGGFSAVSSSTQTSISANDVAKWSTTAGTWAPLGSATQNGAVNTVYALAVLGTDLYVGGAFTTVGSSTQTSISANRVAKWSTAGGTANTWAPLGGSPSVQNGTGSTVTALAVLGTDLYVGGSFSTVSSSTQTSISANDVAKWSPTTNVWAPLGGSPSAQNGTSSQVNALAVLGTDLYVGGIFTTVSSSTQTSISANRVAKWSTAGGTANTWAPLGSAAQNGTGSNVAALAVSGTDLYAGGSFTTVSDSIAASSSANRVAKWSTSTSTWALLGSATQNGTSGTVAALAVSGTDLYVGGSFTTTASAGQSVVPGSHLGVYGPVAVPNLVVEQPVNTVLADGVSSVAFGTFDNGVSSAPVTFILRNTSTTLGLTLGALTVDGAGAADYVVSAPGSTTLAANGGSTTFTVTFTPSAAGVRRATLRIASTAPGVANPFDVALTGSGNNPPVLALPGSPFLAEIAGSTGVVNFTVTASDVEDGALTPVVTPASGSVFPLGDTTVSVSATDSRGLVTTGSFVVRVTANAPPVITLNQASTISVYVGSSFTDPGATANDLVSGNVTVSTVSTVNTTVAGSYTITYTATDAAGIVATATRTVNVASSPVWAENFPLPGGVNGAVNAIAQTSDAFYYGGSFTTVGSVAANNIVRVDKATGVVSALGTATQNGVTTAGAVVNALAVIGTDLYVGGLFTTVSDSSAASISANRVAKWSTSTSTWSALGSAAQNGTNSTVSALAVLGTDLYVGGIFTTASSSAQNGIIANRVAKWSTTASTWVPLGTATQNGATTASSGVSALAVLGTDLYVGGTFTTVSDSSAASISANRVAKWSTSTSTWAPLGSATQNGATTASSGVYALAVSGTDLYVGGTFTTVSDSSAASSSAIRVAKWSTTANTWSPLGTATQNGTSSSVFALAVLGADLYVGGLFTTVSDSSAASSSANRVAKWSTAGGTWAPLGTATQNGTSNTVYALAVSGTDLCVGGTFLAVSDSTQLNAAAVGAARWSSAASTWATIVPGSYGDGVNGQISAVVDAGSVVYVGGQFTRAGNVATNNVACWTKATRTWSALGSTALNGTNSSVYALAVLGTDLYVGGAFFTVSSSTQNAISASYVAKWSATAGTWAPLGSATQNGTSSFVNALAVGGTNLYVGGLFTTVSSSTQNAITANRVAKWDTLTSLWSPLGSATQNGVTTSSSTVTALAVLGTGLYAAGDFTTVSDSTQASLSVNRIARWDTGTGLWSRLGSAAQNGLGSPFSIYVGLAAIGTDLYVGGSFTTVSSSTQTSISARYVAKWDTLASTWSPLGSATQNGMNSQGVCLAVNGTDLYVGGAFNAVSSSTQNGITAKEVAKWDTLASTWAPLGSVAVNGTNNNVLALAVSGTDLYVGGNFTTVSSSTQGTVASSRFGSYGPISGMDISVEQPLNTALTDGSSSLAFGTVNAGISGPPMTFTIKNPGTIALVLGAISVDGTDAARFVASAPASTTILAGGSTTFTVTFTPGTGGARTAALHVASNVSGAKNPFDIALTGTGNALPVLALPGSPFYAETAGSSAVVNFTVSATDAEDGTLTATVNPPSGSVFPLGDTTVSVSATDSGGGTTTGSFVVRVLANAPPVITPTAGSSTTVYVGSSFTDPGATALDVVAGNVTVSAVSTVNANVVGSYTITYTATDPGGNTATFIRPVNVVSLPVWAENFGLPDGIDGSVSAIAETADAYYYGGSFSFVGSVSANNLVRVDKLTRTVSALGSAAQNGTNNNVTALAVLGTDLYVGGQFTTVSSSTQTSISANNVAKWSTTGGTANSWAPLGGALSVQNGTSSFVNALAVSGTDLYVGGSFTTVSSSTQTFISAKQIAKWSTGGGTANTWAPLGSTTQNGTSGSVAALAVLGTDLYVGGQFTTVSSSTQTSISANNVAKWSTAGGTANTWAPLGGAISAQNGTSTTVTALAVLGTDLYVGGAFITVSSSTQTSISANFVAKWSTAGGTANTWAPLGGTLSAQNGTSIQVNALVLLGTDLYVGGFFTTVSSSTQTSISANRVAKWSTTANTWAPLGGALSAQNGTSSTVNALLVSGTEVHVGGSFFTVSSSTQSNLGAPGMARWNPAAGTWAAAVAGVSGDGVNGQISAVVDAGSVVYVGGFFTRAGNVAANNIACWTKATRTWSALGRTALNGTNGSVQALAVLGTDLYVGGQFATVSSSSQNAISANGVAKWSTTANTWTPLGGALSAQNGTNSSVNALAVLGTDLYVGGAFTTVSDSTQTSISASKVAKWSTTANTWSPLGSPTQNGVTSASAPGALAVIGTGLYVAGAFTTVSDSTQASLSVNRIARWDTGTSTWSRLGSAAQNGTNSTNTLTGLAVIGTDLYVTSNFTTVSSSTQNAITANRVAKWDTLTSAWSLLGSATQNGVNSQGVCLAVNGTDLYVGGAFNAVSSSTQNGITANRVAKWDTLANTWAPLGSAAVNGTNSIVYALAVSGTDLYAGGIFNIASSSQGTVASSRFGSYGPISGMDISVEQPLNTALTDGSSSLAFGTVNAGISGPPMTFTIKNPGTIALVLGAISVDGTDAARFVASAPASTTILAGGSTTFTVTFTPGTGGARTAALHVASNLTGAKNPFDIALTGTGNALPVLTLPGSPVIVEATGPGGANVPFTFPNTVTASDAEDGTLTPSVTPASGSLFALGDTTVNVSATDSHAATTTGSFIVRVVDTTSPVITVPAPVTLPATSAAGRVVTFSTSATDTVSGTRNTTAIPASGSTLPLGTTTVTVSATDAAGNPASASFTVTVTNNAPVVTLLGASPLTFEAAATYTDAGATASDVEDVTRTPTITSSTVVANVPGTYAVTWSATDTGGLTSTATRPVTVVDTTAPVVAVHANVSVLATSSAGAVVPYAAGSATDVVTASPTITYSQNSGTTFPIGVTTVTITAKDAANNTGTRTFTVTVINNAPVVTLLGASPLTFEAAATYTDAGATASDVEDVTRTPTITSNTVVANVPGTYAVTWSATDTGGLTSTATRPVTVVDTTGPVITGVPANINTVATSEAGAVVSFTSPTALDVVDGPCTVTCVPVSGSTFGPGTTTVHCTAGDTRGNTSSASFTVTVGNAAPVVAVDGTVTPSFSSTASLAGARYDHTATLLANGQVLAVGGYGHGIMNTAELYDPATRLWAAAGSLATNRTNHTATLLANGQVLVVGGQGNSGVLSSAELYDPAANAWSAAGSLGTARFSHTATLLGNGQVLVVGGTTGADGLDSAELYDPATNQWTPARSLAAGRAGHTATLLGNGQVLVAGGTHFTSGPLSSAELYEATTNTWTPAGSLGNARISHTATRLATGQVLVTGGYGNSGRLDSAELYDATTHTWTPTGSLMVARPYHTATLLASGQVMVAGGGDAGSDLDSAEVYDLGTGQWTPAGNLAQARYQHTATLLANGQVLVAGGNTTLPSSALASAELFNDGSVNLQVAEATPATMTGTFSDANGNTTATLTASSGAITQNNTAGTWSWSATVNDGPAIARITITATDDASATATASFFFTVNNVAPAFDLGGNARLTAGSGVLSRTVAFTDPGADTWTGTVDYGDGSDPESLGVNAGARTFALGHTYATSGTFNVSVTLNDDDGGSFTGTYALTVHLNLPPTDITLTPSGLLENSAVGATVGTLTATDANAGDSHTFALVAGDGDTDNASFTLVDATLKAGQSFDFETKSSYTLRVRCTDAEGEALEKALTVTIIDVPEPVMVLTGRGLPIPAGASIPSTSDDTDFGTPNVSNTQVTHTFTLSNAGDGALHLTGSPLVQISGPAATDFRVTLLPPSLLAPGASTPFAITFDPTLPGVRTATVSIASDDPPRSPSTFAISGNGGLTTLRTQTLTFTAPATIYPGQSPLALNAYASSGLPVTLSLVSAGTTGATLSGNALTVTTAGTMKVQAAQAGGGNYKAATPVVLTLTVKANPTLAKDMVLLNLTQAYDSTARMVSTLPAGATVTYKQGTTLVPSPTKAGAYTVTAVLGTGPAAVTKTGTLTITKAPLYVTPADQRKFAGWTNPPFTFSPWSGFQGSDSISLITTLPTLSTTATSASGGGQYPITAKGGTVLANYTYVYRQGTLVVESFAGSYEALLVNGTATPVGKLTLSVPLTSQSFTGKLYTATETTALALTGRLTTSPSTALANGLVTVLVKGIPYEISVTLPLYGDVTASVTRNYLPLAFATDGRRLLALPTGGKVAYAGAHTGVLEPALPAGAAVPAGAGWATATISTAGVLTLAGQLGDGTAFTSALSPDGDSDPGYRVFVQPYLVARTQSWLGGQFRLKAHPNTAQLPGRRYLVAASLTWTKTGLPADASYRAGFGPVTTVMMLDPWLPPVVATKTVAAVTLAQRLGLTGSPAPFSVAHSATGSAADANLPTGLSLSSTGLVSVVAPVTIPVNSTKWKATFTAATGVISGSFELADPGLVKGVVTAGAQKRTVPFTGILRQPASAADTLIGDGNYLLPPLIGAGTEKLAGEVMFQRP